MNDFDTETADMWPTGINKSRESVSSLIYLPMMNEERIIGYCRHRVFPKECVHINSTGHAWRTSPTFVAIALDMSHGKQNDTESQRRIKAAQAQHISD
jgi:hypothetical protein